MNLQAPSPNLLADIVNALLAGTMAARTAARGSAARVADVSERVASVREDEEAIWRIERRADMVMRAV